MAFQDPYGLSRLATAGLHQQVAIRGQPATRACRNSPLHVKSIRATIERDTRLVLASLPRHQPDQLSRDVGGVCEQQVHAPSKRRRQRFIEITLDASSARESGQV